MKVLAYLAVFAISGASTVYSADLGKFPPPEPVPPIAPQLPSFPWDGPYVGIHAGYGWNRATFGGCPSTVCEDFDGKRVGMFAGHNWTMASGYVVGIEGDINYDWNGKPFGGADEVGTDYSVSLRGRAGYNFGNVLLYAAAGWTAANAYVRSPDDDTLAHGFTVGGGTDWSITPNTFIRAEYRYNDFAEVGLFGLESDFDQHVLNIGVGVKF